MLHQKVNDELSLRCCGSHTPFLPLSPIFLNLFFMIWSYLGSVNLTTVQFSSQLARVSMSCLCILSMLLMTPEIRPALPGLFDNTWLVFNWPINRFSSKCKPPGWGQTTVTSIHFSTCSKGQCEMWQFWYIVGYIVDMYPPEPQPHLMTVTGIWSVNTEHTHAGFLTSTPTPQVKLSKKNNCIYSEWFLIVL